MMTTTTSLSAQQITQKILNSKGQFVKAFWKSEPKPSAAFKQVKLEKITEGVVRAGIDYANLSSVQQGIASGERGEVQSLPWGEWKKNSDGTDCFPYIIEHKGTDYIRLYPSIHRPHSTFFVDGSEVDKNTFAGYLTPSEATKLLKPTEDDVPACFTIKLENILGTPVDVD